jgi:CDP-glucose 4,6-dehydratase
VVTGGALEGLVLMDNQHWKLRRVLVTGATGLLGSWLTNTLIETGATVTCLIRDTVPQSYLVSSGAIQRVNIVQGGLEDYFTVLRAVNEYEIETVFHLGAQTIVGTASRSALSTFESNIKGTWNLLEACSACGKLVKAIVVASSDKAYGSHPKLPYTEETPLQGRFPYDVSKSCADLLAHSYYETHCLPVGITRCGNLYGGGDLNFSRIVPGTIRSVLLGECPVIRSDGKFVRDYFYVEDAVQAVLILAETLASGRVHGEAFNFGTETPVSVIELVDQIVRVMGCPEVKPIILNQANHEIREQFLDCTKARKRLNWGPNFSLQKGLARAVDWYRGFFGTADFQLPREQSANV